MTPAIIHNITTKITRCWEEYKLKISEARDEAIVETCFLSDAFTSDCIKVDYEGEAEITVSAYGREETYSCHRFIITGDDTIDGPTGETLFFHYFNGDDGLFIFDSVNNILYWREDMRDPRTEWLINGLADSFEDEHGNIVFKGDPVNI